MDYEYSDRLLLKVALPICKCLSTFKMNELYPLINLGVIWNYYNLVRNCAMVAVCSVQCEASVQGKLSVYFQSYFHWNKSLLQKI